MENSESGVTNPLQAIGLDSKQGEGLQSMGLVMSRAGLGKTAILVQFALDCMMNNKNVLHVSIGEGVDKIRTWYDDIVANLDVSPSNISALMSKRMIMTFKESDFTKAVLAERIEDLVEQKIYIPECLVIDGYDFDTNDRAALEEVRDFATEIGINMMWFSGVNHRTDDRVSVDGIPAPCHDVGDLFETALLINPVENEIELKILKCGACAVDPGTVLTLDPSTMLIKQA